MEKKFVNVKFLKPAPGFAYKEGDTGIVLAEKAPELLKFGYIIIIPETERNNPLPEDLPARDKLFDAGYDTIEKIKEAGDSLTEIGLSKTIIKKIQTYLTDK